MDAHVEDTGKKDDGVGPNVNVLIIMTTTRQLVREYFWKDDSYSFVKMVSFLGRDSPIFGEIRSGGSLRCSSRLTEVEGDSRKLFRVCSPVVRYCL